MIINIKLDLDDDQLKRILERQEDAPEVRVTSELTINTTLDLNYEEEET